MFELNGRHLKSFVGKDFIDHLIACVDAGLVRVDLDAEVSAAEVDTRLTLVEGRVDLVRRDLARSDQRVDVVVARAAEDADAILNEKWVMKLVFNFKLLWICNLFGFCPNDRV